MARGFRASCGRVLCGKEPIHGDNRLCFACDRPGSRDRYSSKWMHVGSSQYWAELGGALGECGLRIREGWAHQRNLQDEPLQVGECICCRSDCVAGLHNNFKVRLPERRERFVPPGTQIPSPVIQTLSALRSFVPRLATSW